MSATATIVVRSSGERTLGVCVDLIKNQSGEFNIHVIEEQPFDAALLSCYKIGVESGAEWLITVDADTLLVDYAINTLITEAKKMPQNYFQLQGTVYDYITGEVRTAGQRIYRAMHLHHAIKYLEASETRIRPEYSTVRYMVENGYPSREISSILGLHDFDQYYKDYYRKSFIHATKHEELLPVMIRRCKSNMEQNSDFKVILMGLQHGIGNISSISIDSRLYTKRANQALNNLKLKEKDADLVRISPEINYEIDRISNSKQTIEYGDIIITGAKNSSKLLFCRKILTEKGIIRGVFYLGGLALTNIGNRLQSF